MKEIDQTVTPATEQLVRCFELIFQIEGVSPQDDFFELGGDSLAAAQLLVEIEKRWGFKLPSTLLIEHPVISNLASVLELGPVGYQGRAIVPIKSSGTLPPIYMIHGHTGDLWVALSLAPHLLEDQPLCGIRPDFNNTSFSSLNALAKQNVELLISAHPRQDYQLLGYSFGGMLAYEMARQLVAGGHNVSFLGIVDVTPASNAKLRQDMRPDMRSSWARLRDRWLREGMVKTLAWSTHRIYSTLRNQLVQQPLRKSSTVQMTHSPGSAEPEPMRGQDPISQFERSAVNALLDYVPGSYSGDILHLTTQQVDNVCKSELPSDWSGYTSGAVEVIFLEGDHDSIIRNPGIQQIAAGLNHRKMPF